MLSRIRKMPFVLEYLSSVKKFDKLSADIFTVIEKSVIHIIEMVLASKVARISAQSARNPGENIQALLRIFLTLNSPIYPQTLALSSDFSHLRKIERILEKSDIDRLLECLLQAEYPLDAVHCMMRLGELDKNMDMLSDWMAINHFLTNKKLVLTYMDQLEQQLQEYVAQLNGDWAFPKNDDGKFVLPTSADKKPNYCCYKVLSNFFYQWAQDNGFNSRATILTRVKAKRFNSMLAEASFFKDYLNVGHGFWSHMQQWYAIVEHQKKTGFLQHNPIELYKAMGDTNRHSDGGSFMIPPWDQLVDRIGYDGRAPNFFTTNMLDDYRKRWPLLAGSISRQYRKHEFKMKEHLEKMNVKHKDEAVGGIVTRAFVRSKL